MKSPVTKMGTPGFACASCRARWSSIAAPSRRCASLTWSRCVLSSRSSPPARRKCAHVARRGVPAPGNHEPGLKGSWESQNVSVATMVSAELGWGREDAIIFKVLSVCVWEWGSPAIEDRTKLARRDAVFSPDADLRTAASIDRWMGCTWREDAPTRNHCPVALRHRALV